MSASSESLARARAAPAHEPGVLEAVSAAASAAADAASRYVALIELEARDASARLIVVAALVGLGVLLLFAGWLFAAAAAVAALVSGYGASPPVALLVVGIANLVLFALTGLAALRLIRRPWFEATRRQIALAVPDSEPHRAASIEH